jgi:hypothetical protein
MFKRAASLSFALAVVACGSKSGQDNPPDAMGSGSDAGGSDSGAGSDAAIAVGAPMQPIVMNAGGNVMPTVKIVPVFFANDATAQAQLETFLAQLAPSSYWTAISGEYGVGAMTIAPSVIATETPPTSDAALQTLITAHAGGTGGWPASTPTTIYSVFLPDGVTFSFGGGTSCVDFGGYHDETNAGVIYALMPRCTSATFPGLEDVTIAASHEYLEAATDPHPMSNPAFNIVNDDEAIWGLLPGGELGDMCEFNHAAYQPLLGTFMVQRTWSNVSAAAGHDPCVPVLATPYVVATTNVPDITIDGGGGQSLVTRGVTVAVGESKVVEVDLYSDGDAPDWTVEAFDVASKFQMQPAELMLTLDRPTGHNGDKLMLTITRLKAAGQFGISELALRSSVSGVSVGSWFTLVN